MRRAHELEMGELRAISKGILDKAESYNVSLDTMILEQAEVA